MNGQIFSVGIGSNNSADDAGPCTTHAKPMAGSGSIKCKAKTSRKVELSDILYCADYLKYSNCAMYANYTDCNDCIKRAGGNKSAASTHRSDGNGSTDDANCKKSNCVDGTGCTFCVKCADRMMGVGSAKGAHGLNAANDADGEDSAIVKDDMDYAHIVETRTLWTA